MGTVLQATVREGLGTGELAAGVRVAALVAEDTALEPWTGLPDPLRAALARAAGTVGFVGGRDQRAGGEAGVATVEVCGLGPLSELDCRRVGEVVDRVVRDAERARASRLLLLVPSLPAFAGPEAAMRVLVALALATYRFDVFRRPPSSPAGPFLRHLEVLPPDELRDAWAATAPAAAVLARAIAVARELGNQPPNQATPAWLAEQASALAAPLGATVEVIDAAAATTRGLGGLLAVGGGSAHPPCLVRLAWGTEGPTVALVGKGVTFDSGGISIKPAKDMAEMKYDKAGACAVLACFAAAAELGLRLRLTAYLPLAENMLGGGAYRPGDVVRCYGGTTVDVVDTDAEGRLILADALALAAEERPDVIVELSTLTGACVVALGTTGAGLFTPDDALAGELLAAAEAAGERLWRLPLWREHAEAMDGEHADLRNAGPRWGGASTAAAFLARFVGDHPRWAHLDIAGPAYLGSDTKPYAGATGFGVATLLEWLRRLARVGHAAPVDGLGRLAPPCI